MGIGEGSKKQGNRRNTCKELTAIAGQKALITKAKKSISNFKIRKGMTIGAKVTLRGPRMYNFVYKLINLVLPKVRDFRGLNPNSFDGKGNYNFGLTEQLVFPEISHDQTKRIQDMDIVIVTTAKRDEESRRLLELLGFPIQKAVIEEGKIKWRKD